MVAGRGTVALPRRRYRAEIGVRPAPNDTIRASSVKAAARALAKAAASQPAVSEAEAARAVSGLTVTMVVEAAELAGAVTVAFGVTRQALGGGPWATTAISAAEMTVGGALPGDGR